MYSRDTLVLLQHYLDLKISKTAIAQQLGLNRRTIHHWITTGQLDRECDAAEPRRPRPRPQQLDRYKPLIDARLSTYPALSAVRLFDECRAAGVPRRHHAASRLRGARATAARARAGDPV